MENGKGAIVHGLTNGIGMGSTEFHVLRPIDVYKRQDKQLTAALLRKANLLPFAKNYTIVPVLFLKNAPKGDSENVMLPDCLLYTSGN